VSARGSNNEGTKDDAAQVSAEEQARLDAQDAGDLHAEFGEPATPMGKQEAEAYEKWRERDEDRRARFGGLPKPPGPGDTQVLYGRLNHLLRHLNDARR
jgi:hypothetical protein